MIAGIVLVVAAMIASAVSARQFSRAGRGTPSSRLLLVLGLLLWVGGVFVLLPASWFAQLTSQPLLATALRAVAAYVIGTALSKIWYAMVP